MFSLIRSHIAQFRLNLNSKRSCGGGLRRHIIATQSSCGQNYMTVKTLTFWNIWNCTSVMYMYVTIYVIKMFFLVVTIGRGQFLISSVLLAMMSCLTADPIIPDRMNIALQQEDTIHVQGHMNNAIPAGLLGPVDACLMFCNICHTVSATCSSNYSYWYNITPNF